MAQHKWHKEIKAWADGKEIEIRFSDRKKYEDDWSLMCESCWDDDAFEFRIKPQPKEPKYLYVFSNGDETHVSTKNAGLLIKTNNPSTPYICVGKIKLEDNDNGND
jgi:hypothetical protein